jgi:hypothetical protein
VWETVRPSRSRGRGRRAVDSLPRHGGCARGARKPAAVVLLGARAPVRQAGRGGCPCRLGAASGAVLQYWGRRAKHRSRCTGATSVCRRPSTLPSALHCVSHTRARSRVPRHDSMRARSPLSTVNFLGREQ